MSTQIKYKNYTVTRADELNWQWTRTDTLTAVKNHRNPSTGEVVRKTGETYQRESTPRFFGDVGSALAGIVKDLLGRDCADISQIASQLGQIKSDLSELTKGIR